MTEENIENNIEAFKAPGVFNLDKFLIDAAYPSEEVIVFTDAFSGNEYLKLLDKKHVLERKIKEAEEAKRADNQRTIAGLETTTPVDTQAWVNAIAELDKPMSDLSGKIEKTALTIEVRGMPPGIVENITSKYFPDRNKDYTNTPEEDERDFELISRSIVKVTDANGNSTNGLDVDQVKSLKAKLIDDEYMRLVKRVAHVNLNGALFDQATDASFLSRRTNLAG